MRFRRAPQETPVRFGTSGVRGILGEDFSFARARALARAVAETLPPGSSSRIIVVHDTRFLGERLAREAAAVVAGAGLRPWVAGGPTPTPVACHAVRHHRAAAGLLFTASHNPPEYQGLKLVGPEGRAAPRSWTARVERRVAQLLGRGTPMPIGPGLRHKDFVTPYLTALGARLDPAPRRGASRRLVLDLMHGTAAGTLDRLVREVGWRPTLLHAEPDPCFGGMAPDPTPERLVALGREVRRRRALVGLATDGDGDRWALVDEKGRRLAESDALALLVDHLGARGDLGRGLALSIATGSLPARVARAHGASVTQLPIGFAALGAALAERRADVAGDESGGFAWSPLARDKDGILAAGLLLERLAGDRRPLSEQLRTLRRAHGGGRSGRSAIPMGPRRRARLDALTRHPPRRFDGARVIDVDRQDGLRCRLDDGGFVMWRASGTEPAVRVYAEAPNPRALRRRLALGAARIGG